MRIPRPAWNPLIGLVNALILFFVATVTAQNSQPTLEEVLADKRDLWGLAAMRQPNGPSHEFFEHLLPPLRYVNAEFRHYPIVLSAPRGLVKARLVSNGSALNARANGNAWREVGVPVTFSVGNDGSVFGADLKKLDGPHLESGWLPIVQSRYSHGAEIYQQETFAATDPVLAANGIVFMRFNLSGARSGMISARFDKAIPLTADNGMVRNTNGQVVAWFGDDWKWAPDEKTLATRLNRSDKPVLAFATKPLNAGAAHGRIATAKTYTVQRDHSVRTWKKLLGEGTQISVPEEIVNNARRALLVSLFTLVNGDRMHYSAGNSYDRQYEAESGDAVRALLLFGFADDARRMQTPLLDYVQPGLRYHDAAFKLQMLSHYFWLTRDTNYLSATRKQWDREAGYIINAREAGNGLLPRENYCGDIHTQVYSLNSSANSWRGLHDFAAALNAVGDSTTAATFKTTADAFRKSILAAVEKSERRDVKPTFIPIALFGEEKPYDVLTDSQLGGYWCLMAPYLLGSGLFGPGAERERAIVDYLHEHGGVAMGMIRFHQHSGLFANEDALDDLYGLRYTVKLLELDEVDRALTSFYGKLAQGLTRETFLGAEGTGLRPLDEFGRAMYLPPVSSAQAYALWILRYLLVQDWDTDDDGQPDTLRLGFATSKRWLENGKTITVERAPTAFGPVSFRLQSQLDRGFVLAEVELPNHNHPVRTRLRIRVPDGWKVTSARAGREELQVDDFGTADLTSLRGKLTIRFTVKKL